MIPLLLSLTAQASSLDVIAVGGAYGTPGATDAHAVFWNPAGLAVGDGTSIALEVAPTFATIDLDLDQGGKDQLAFNGVVPYFGVSSDFGHAPFAAGLALSVPQARGGTSVNTPADDVYGPGGGSGRMALKDGGSQLITGTASVAYHIKDKVALGGSFHFIHSSWNARVDTETVTALNENLCETGFCNNYQNADGTYQDELIQDPDYGTELRFNNLQDTTFSFSGGVYVTPIEQLGISLAYTHGGSLSHTGPVSMAFSCPPEGDVLGRLGASLRGLCDANMAGDAVVAYGMPWRIHWGIVGKPIPALRLELLGSVIGHQAFKDYDITTVVDPNTVDTFDADQTDERELAAELASQNRLWARDNRTSFFVGIDAKGRILDGKLMLGGRVTYDRAAVPTNVLGPNNIDFDEILLAPVVSFSPIRQLEVGVSYTRHILLPRTSTESLYQITIDPENGIEDRYFYPSTTGTYSGGINRIGVIVRSQLGGPKVSVRN